MINLEGPLVGVNSKVPVALTYVLFKQFQATLPLYTRIAAQRAS
jgi:hypothetical protein